MSTTAVLPRTVDTRVLPEVRAVRPVRHPAGRSGGSTYRLTRRGRLVVFALALLAVMAVGLLLAGGSAASPEAEPTTTVVVAPGETLWGIAGDLAAERGDADVRSMMERLEKLNGLESSMLMAGQRLEVPLD
ncbi:MAG: hypothetical protein CMH83_07765 [Nocardioides sp.]|nr:hypothetical protein [Nocardioides sp.]